jgi:hypothetical protein
VAVVGQVVLESAQAVSLTVASVSRTIFLARTSTGVVAAAVQATLLAVARVVSVAVVQEHSTPASAVTASTGVVGVVAVL